MKKYIATLIALSAILSCDVREAARTPQEPEAPQREEGVMYFEPMYPGSTKATETAFEQGDVIGLYVTDYQGETAPPLQISGNWANNVSATIDFTTGSVTKDLFGEMATIKARKVNDSTFEAIIVPQRLDTRRPFIEIIAGGISYLLEDTFQFKPGMQHTLSLTINSNPDQIEIEIGGDIEDGDWN